MPKRDGGGGSDRSASGAELRLLQSRLSTTEDDGLGDEDLTGDTVRASKSRRRFDDDEGEPRGRSRPVSAPWQGQGEEPDHASVAIREAPEREASGRTAPEVSQQTESRTPHPFTVARRTAQQIETRDFEEKQADLAGRFKAAMQELDLESKKKIFWMLVRDVMDGRVKVPGLFAVALRCGMGHLAHNVAALVKAVHEGDLGPTDLVEAGLAEAKAGNNGRPNYFQYFVGHGSLKEAVPKLEASGKTVAAEVLKKHLRQGETHRLLQQANRPQADEDSTAEAEAASDEASANGTGSGADAPAAEVDGGTDLEEASDDVETPEASTEEDDTPEAAAEAEPATAEAGS